MIRIRHPAPTLTCHFCASVAGHVCGALNPVAFPSRLLPRHCDQSCADANVAPVRSRTPTTGPNRRVASFMIPPTWFSWSLVARTATGNHRFPTARDLPRDSAGGPFDHHVPKMRAARKKASMRRAEEQTREVHPSFPFASLRLRVRTPVSFHRWGLPFGERSSMVSPGRAMTIVRIGHSGVLRRSVSMRCGAPRSRRHPHEEDNA